MNAGSIIRFVERANDFIQAHSKRARRDDDELRVALQSVPQLVAYLKRKSSLVDGEERLVDLAVVGERLYRLARDLRGSRALAGQAGNWRGLEEGWPHLQTYLRRHRPHQDFVLLSDLIQRVMDEVLTTATTPEA